STTIKRRHANPMPHGTVPSCYADCMLIIPISVDSTIAVHPDQAWIQQMARYATGEAWRFLDQRRYALHDRGAKFCWVIRAMLAAGDIKPIQLPARSPNLNSHAERWVRSGPWRSAKSGGRAADGVTVRVAIFSAFS